MLSKTADVCKAAREKGAKVILAPIIFKEDGSDNPNKNLGILAGCNNDKLFTEGTWNAEFCDAMKPQEGDLIVKGKKGLDAFPGTDLEELLVNNGIETVALCGFLTNCCVESTMRTAFEKGFNTVTLTDCCATTSAEGQKGAAEGTFGMFSKPMTAEAFITEVNNAPADAPEAKKAGFKRDNLRAFASGEAKGGCKIEAGKTAVVCIEFQNEFATEGGKLYPAVKDVMAETNMLSKTADVCKAAREKGAKVILAPIIFKEDGSDNPNKNLGILAGCNNDKLFTEGTWNAEFCDAMKPQEGDLIVKGKKGLDAFPGTDLEELLVTNGIETVAVCGFLTNCCVESTMRTAFEKGFNTVTLTDCCATTSAEGQKGAAEGTFGMFSKPMTAEAFTAEL